VSLARGDTAYNIRARAEEPLHRVREVQAKVSEKLRTRPLKVA
jgi:hypothetical protein